LQGRSRCDLHPTRWRGGGTRAWRVQRARILERDGHRCTHVDAYGQRCHVTEQLQVHHRIGGHVINVDDSLLVTVCRKHHPRGDYE
jgi:hypothetical protein